MRVKKSDINVFSSKDRDKILAAIKGIVIKTDPVDNSEVLSAIKDIKLEPIIVEQKIPDEILEQQRVMIDKMEGLSATKDYPTYHFEVHRNSEGFIKSVDATPTKVDTVKDRSVAKAWYKR